jgi:hypothetical protein
MAEDLGGVHIRPVEERDLPALERTSTDPALSEPFEWRGYGDPRAWRRRWERDGFLSPAPAGPPPAGALSAPAIACGR